MNLPFRTRVQECSAGQKAIINAFFLFSQAAKNKINGSHHWWPGAIRIQPCVDSKLCWKKYVFGFVLDTMDNWDQDKLEEVIEKKHGEKGKSMPKTEIVS